MFTMMLEIITLLKKHKEPSEQNDLEFIKMYKLLFPLKSADDLKKIESHLCDEDFKVNLVIIIMLINL